MPKFSEGFFSISIPQALDVYDELVKAYFDVNHYGGDVAEIYCYRLCPSNPTASAAKQADGPLGEGLLLQALREEANTAARNLNAVILHFQKNYPDAEVRFEENHSTWRTPIAYLRGGITHRVHVRVRIKEAGKK